MGRVYGQNKKPIPMLERIITKLNKDAASEDQQDGVVYGDIDNLNTINDLEALPDEENPEFADDDTEDRSYTTSDDSTCDGDN